MNGKALQMNCRDMPLACFNRNRQYVVTIKNKNLKIQNTMC